MGIEMNIKDIVKSQYHASLEMLRQAIIKCPDPLWDGGEYKNAFWRVAYHALFFTHLYLQVSLEDFCPWAKHKENYEALDHQLPRDGEPYTKGEVLEYCEMCGEQIEERVASLEPDAPSGFHWLPFSKLELQFYNIRHLQQHTGELCERLGARGDIEVGWVGQAPREG
jgi:hypothetical protein